MRNGHHLGVWGTCLATAIYAACSVESRDPLDGESQGLPPGGALTDGPAGDGGDIKFDLGDTDGGPGPGDNSGDGCKKVDFLFVVDNSGSMADEQQNLADSFPGFIAEIQDTVARDYQIMVVDTDAGAGGGCFMSTNGVPDCNSWCDTQCTPGCECICNGNACTMPGGDTCDETLGAGRVTNPGGAACGVEGDRRFMTETQPDLPGTFSCVATVGTGGDGNERPMGAMMEAVTSQSGAGACNDGFIRDDAILVVTVITDEEDLGKSIGDPSMWAQTLIDAKGGNPSAIVALALVGDTNVMGGICMPYTEGGDGAEDAPRLRAWAEAFEFGQWSSVCAPNYTDFFSAAVSVIGTACDEFEPVG